MIINKICSHTGSPAVTECFVPCFEYTYFMGTWRCSGNVSYLCGPAKTTNIQHDIVNFCCWCPSMRLFHEMTRETNKNSHCSKFQPSHFLLHSEQSTTTILTLVVRIITVGSGDTMIFTQVMPCHCTAATKAKATNRHKCT